MGKSSLKNDLKSNWVGYLLILPALISIFALALYPLARGIFLSFINYNLVRPFDPTFGHFAGLDNYITIFQNGFFQTALINTVKWTITNLLAQLIMAMLLALALNYQKLRFKSIARTLSLVPWAVPAAIAAMAYSFIFNVNIGALNTVLMKMGLLSHPYSWLGNVNTAFWCVSYVAIWRGIPFQMIFILAALQSISDELYESAKIDGASNWKSFWNITMPIIKEPFAIATVLNLIGILSSFNTIYLMTSGGPLNSTEILYTYAYREAFINHNFGTASAASVILFIFTTIISVIYIKMSSSED